MIDPLEMDIEGRSEIREEISLAPLIDVTLLLLIFFMLTSTILRPEAVELALPGSSTAELAPDAALVVGLATGGALTLGGEPVSRDALRAAVATALATDPERPVEMRTDAQLPVQDMVDLMDLLRSAGVRNLALATRPTAGGGD